MISWARPKAHLDDADIDKGLRCLLYDSVFAQIMLVLTLGPFLVAFALHLGASNKTIGVMAAIGPIAQIIQIPAIFLVEWVRLRKALTVVAVFLSRLGLIGIGLTPWIIPSAYRIPAFLGFLSLFFAVGAVAGCAYNSWIRDLIPVDRMNAFFSRRLAVATAVGAGISFLAGVGIDQYTERVGPPEQAYTILFIVGAVFGLIAMFFLARTPEPVMPTEDSRSIVRMLLEPFRDVPFRNLLIFLGAWSFAVNFAAPFFAVYLISYLGMNMTWVLTLSVFSQIVNVLFFGVWGRLADRFSNKSVLMLCVPVFFLTFLLWPFTTMPERYMLTIPILAAIHVLAGITTAGVALCAGNLALKTAPYGKGTAYLAVNALISGIAATVSPLLAGLAADWFEPYQVRMTLSSLLWESGDVLMELPTLDFRGLDFIFIIAFVLGIYSVHRLLAVREEGEVQNQVIRQAFLGEVQRMVRQVSTIAGMRQIIVFPFAYLPTLRRTQEPEVGSLDKMG